MITIDEAIANETEMAQGIREQYECMMECSDIFREKKKVFIEQCKHDAEYHEQLVDLLEELKAIKEMDLDIPQHFTKEQSVWIKAYCIKRNIEFYNKAIDDFIHECDKCCGFYAGNNKNLTREDMLNIAEQLKEQK